MKTTVSHDNQALVDFWSRALSMSEEDRENIRQGGPDGWKEMAPSEKLFRAAASLGACRKALDYGCGSGWAAVAAAKYGCPDVTAVDPAPGAAEAAAFCAALYGAEGQVHASCVPPDWLESVVPGTFDGVICSNVLDVVPPETAEGILRGIAGAAAPGARVVIGLNFYMSEEAAAARGMELADGRMLYVDGVLRLVSRTDDEWAVMFDPYFTVEELDHFAWPGEAAETRRLFRLRRRMDE